MWLFKRKDRAHNSTRSSENVESDEARKATVASAERLVEVINESLIIADESKNAETKTSRLDVAKQRLDELKALAKEHPYIDITHLPEVEQSISELEWEFTQAQYREAAEGNERGNILEKEGKIDEATAEYEKLLEAGVDTPFIYRRLAIIYSKQKRIDEELRVLRVAIKTIPVESGKHYRWFAERLAKKS